METFVGQTKIIFFHTSENSSHQENFYHENKLHFTNKCKQVFNILMAGKELTVLDAAIKGISSLPKRIQELEYEDGNPEGKKLVEISRRKSETKPYYLFYYMSEEQILFNKKFI